jgi:ribosomal protein S18 acetylase RimI-like enzyme
MVVSAAYRNQGVGAKLLRSAIACAEQHDCRRITLLTDQHNLSAQKFYLQHGFQKSAMTPFRLLLPLS